MNVNIPVKKITTKRTIASAKSCMLDGPLPNGFHAINANSDAIHSNGLKPVKKECRNLTII